MAEFKFYCPQCNQHILCDTSHSGMQVNCPTCKQAIIVPQAPGSAAAPPPPPGHSSQAPPGLSTRQGTAALSGGRQLPGAPGAQPIRAKSHTLRNVLVITAVIVVFAALGGGGWHFYSKHRAKVEAAKGNPAAQVPTPSATQSAEALDVLMKMHQAYTNLTSYSADVTVTVFVDLSRVTAADLNPNRSANKKNATRRPPGMPMTVTNTTDLSFKRARPALFRIAGDSKTEVGRMTITNTFAFWSSDEGNFMFMDPHQRGARATYMQLPDSNTALAALGMNGQMGLGMATPQQFFGESGMMTKLVKDLGRTDDESSNGQDCYTLTAKVLGQKVKVWVNKASYMILQWQITLGGAISDADIDDAFAAFNTGTTTTPSPGQLELIKAQVKQTAPVLTKIRGTITSTYNNIEMNQTFAAADFDYPVPQGVRLTRMPGAAASATAASSLEAGQRNACINNLRQIDAAKNEWALEKGKKNGTAVTEADIKPYIKLDANGNLPKCPAGGKYTIGRVGEAPTCSVPGHVLP